ncbi:MAG TPA: MFS transporter [Roseiflexaceae bacterium]|nr:MFS transporter [Roseiflexaceae bacterium]
MFWLGQIISSLGSSITSFALPLLVFSLTGSAFNLALSTTLTLLPYLCFGLIIGAWVDRVDRRRLMIGTDIARALAIALIPLLDWLGMLTEAIYLVIVINATLAIGFDAAGFAALPNLVHPDELVTTNGRMQAGYSTAAIAGPLIAGLLLAVLALPLLLLGDALSFLISAASLASIRSSFTSSGGAAPATSISQAIGEGLWYVVSHPLIRWIIPLSLIVNFVVTPLGRVKQYGSIQE